ncbi:MAG: hypothetical protein J6A23_00510 [Thermoguttaceae bacterium]|nr:hypothetical protein [Thermoguttaceae bacterium]
MRTSERLPFRSGCLADRPADSSPGLRQTVRQVFGRQFSRRIGRSFNRQIDGRFWKCRQIGASKIHFEIFLKVRTACAVP